MMKVWKALVGLFFLLVIVDGALRKWVLPSLATPLLLLKDVVLWGGFVLYALRRSPTELPRPLKGTWVPILLGAYIFVVLLQAFNLRQPSLVVSVIGLKAHLTYLPLVVLVPALVTQASERQMSRLLWGYTLCLFLPVAILGSYQFSQPPSAWVNQYVRGGVENVDALIRGIPRITGTFAYIGSFTPFLAFNAFLGAATLLAGLRWKRNLLMILGGLLLGAALVVMPMTGSRTVLALTGGGLVALFLVARLREWNRLHLLAIVAAVALIVIQGDVGSGLTEGWEAFGERVEHVGGRDAAERRTFSALLAPVRGLDRAGLFGYGVGTTHQASPRFVPGATGPTWLPGGYSDNSVLKSFTELGLLGWMVLVALKATLLYFAYQTVRRSRRPMELIVGATAFCVLLSRLVLPVVFNMVASALYWGTAGAMLGIWSLQQTHIPLSGGQHSVPEMDVRT